MDHHIKAIDEMIADQEKSIVALKALRLFFTLAQDRDADSPHQYITGVVANEFGLTLGRLLGRDQRAAIARPRALAIYLIREYTGKTFIEIAEHFGERHHATIMRSIEHVPNYRQAFPSFNTKMEKIIEALDIHFERA